MTDLNALLPCPFCGGDAIRDGNRFACAHLDCGIGGHEMDIDDWNRRASPAMSAEEVREACAKACEDRPVDKKRCRVLNLPEQAWAEAQEDCAEAIRSLDLSGKEKV